MTDDRRATREDGAPSLESPPDELPPPPVGDERAADVSPEPVERRESAAGSPPEQPGDASSTPPGSSARRPRRAGDDAPAPRWRDRRSRAVGWRSRDIVRATALVIGIFAIASVVWRTNQLFLVAFLGVLFGLAVSWAVDWLHARGLRVIPRGVLAAVIVLGTVGSIVGFFVWSGPTLATQLRELRTRLPEALDQVEEWARQQGGLVANVVLGGDPGVRAAGADTLVIQQVGAESRAPRPAPVLPPLVPAPDTSGSAIADTVGRAILAARDSILARDTLGIVAPYADSLLLAVAESARVAAMEVARVADSVRRADLQRQAAQVEQAARAAAATPDEPSVVVIPPQDTADVAPGVQSLRERALGSLTGVTRYLFPFITSTFAILAGLVLVIFLAIYVAADPVTYRRGIMHLFPKKSRRRAEEVLGAIATVLRKWLVTQLIAMLVIGTVTTIVLYLMDVPAALPLGIIAGLFEFIPNIGPILSAIPAVAMGFVDSPEKAFWVAIAYWAIQFLENQLLIPLLMQEGVDLPPALTLLAQAVLALLFGFLGLFVAVPLVAAGMVAVRMLYVEDVVGEGLDPFDREDTPAIVRRTPPWSRWMKRG